MRRALELGGDLRGRLDRARPWIRCGGQATRDAHAHRLRTILAARCGPYWPRGAITARALRPHRGRQDRRRARARRADPRARRAPGRRRRRRAAGLRRAGDPHRRRRTRAQRARLEHRLVSFVPVDERFSVAEYAALAHAEIDGLLADGATPIVVGGTGLYLRAALARARAAPAAAAGRARALAGRRWTSAARRRCTPSSRRAAPASAARIDPTRPPPHHPRARAARAGRARDDAAAGRTGCGRPTRATRPASSASSATATSSTRASSAASTRWSPPARSSEVRRADAAGASPTARVALGFEELLARRRRGDEAPHAPLRAPPADVDAQAARRRAHRPRRGRDPERRRGPHRLSAR